MKLPPHLQDNIGFVFDDPQEIALACDANDDEKDEMIRLAELGLPPITSTNALAVMTGYNPGFIHSMTVSFKAHYREFEIPKGSKTRKITAPKVAIKGIQTWLSHHFQKTYQPSPYTFGFVPKLSHIDAARQHLNANWVCSVDIENFFPSVEGQKIESAFKQLGYRTPDSIQLLTQICSVKNKLIQGAPTSPVLSNIVLKKLDLKIGAFAAENEFRFTRYADDFTISGTGTPPEGILDRLQDFVTEDGWKIARHKSSLQKHPNRLKVHGLLVHRSNARLTKGYRNRIRAFQYMMSNGKVKDEDMNKLSGHINYGKYVKSLEKKND